MGNRFSPVTDKTVEHGVNTDGSISYVVCGMQGRRSTMEDTHVALLDVLHDENHHLFAVFDGHGGTAASKFAAKHLKRMLLEHPLAIKYQEQMQPEDRQQNSPNNTGKLVSAQKVLLKELFEDIFVQLDREFLISQTQKSERLAEERKTVKDSGTTALVVLVTPTILVCANAGDSRAIVLQDMFVHSNTTTTSSRVPANFQALSFDHRPDVPKEEHRIRKAGGFVFGGRLEEDLAVSRGIGDFRFKEEHITLHGACEEGKRTARDQKVIPHPDVKFQARSLRQRYLLLGCDGVFERMSNEKVVRVLRQNLQSFDMEVSLRNLLDKSLRKGGMDNMTAILVKL